MKNKFFLVFLIIIFSSIFVIFYNGLQNSNVYTPSTKIKKNIPQLSFKLFGSNEQVNSEKIFKKNKFYLMNIWASWCVPCKEEHPVLINLANQKEIEIIGLNYKDNFANAQNFLNKLKNPYKIILSDKDGTIAIEWGAYGVPETFLIYNRKIIKKFIGPLNENSLSEIKRLVK